MSKALDIRKEAKSRVAAAGFATTVIRGKRDFNADELPGVCVYLTDVTKRAESGDRYASDAQLVVEYIRSVPSITGTAIEEADSVDDLADAMIAEVRAAMEIEPRRFGTTRESALIISPGLSYASEEIEYPDDGAGSIAVRVSYSAPFISEHG